MSFIFKILFLKKSFLCTHPNLNTDIFLPRLKIFEVILDQIFKYKKIYQLVRHQGR